ncbi:MAG: alpha/beta fold hydrolase [Chitinivibrionales bacterium]|nr:alpha/beta fold hydrolase [Chitinivibrionales bacterium]
MINGIQTRYWHAGLKGSIVILVHGLGGSVEQWSENIETFSRTHRVYGLDILGCGKTDKPDNADYSIAALAHFLDGFVSAMNIERFCLIGLSLGGGICLRYALEYPAKVIKLVLAASAALGSRMALVFRLATLRGIGEFFNVPWRPFFAAYVRSMVYDKKIITDEIVDFYFPLIKTSQARRAFFHTLRANCNLWGLRQPVVEGVIERLGNLKHPTLILWGNQDRHMPVVNAYEAVKKIPDAQLIFIDRCGHNPQFEHAEEFNRLVIKFLGTKTGEA